MARRTIELPEKFHFTTQYTVLFSDINGANHMGADRVLPITSEAQLRFIKSLGYKNAVLFEDAGLIMVHSEVQYISETDYADELVIDLAVENMSEKSLDFVYRIFNKNKKIETARIKTSMLFFDYDEKKVVAVPQGFSDRFKGVN
ncbi:MAG: thioesterase family protein [Bermanella sp.]